MEFKYHKGYNGFYLLDNGKFKKPFQKLDIELTKINLKNNDKYLSFEKDRILLIDESLVVFANSEQQNDNKKNKVDTIKNVRNNSTLNKYVPQILIDNIIDLIKINGNNVKFSSVAEIIENVLLSDLLFQAKSKKLFFYNKEELKKKLNLYIPLRVITKELSDDIVANYPGQYVYEHLPLDYKEKEMLYVFHFIITVELLSIIK